LLICQYDKSELYIPWYV